MTRLRPRAVAMLATCLCLGTVATACGGPSTNGEEKKSAKNVLADAKAATAKTSFRAVGTISEAKQSFKLDFIVTPKGSGGGTLTIGAAKLQVVAASQYLYLKGAKSAWVALLSGNGLGQSAGSVANMLAGKWWKVAKTNSQVGSLANFASTTKFLGLLNSSGGIAKESSTSKWHGQRVVVLTDRKTGRLYVADTGKPYILAISGSGQGGSGNLTFSDFGKVKAPAAPAHATKLPGA